MLFAICIISATVSSTASAAGFELSGERCAGGTFVNFCWDSVEKGTDLRELVGEEVALVLPEGGHFVLFLGETSGGVHVEVLCEDLHSEPTLVQLKPLSEDATLHGTITFLKCVLLTDSEKCEALAEQTTNELEGSLPNLTGAEFNDITLKPKQEAGTWLEVEIRSKAGQTCPATMTGKHPVKGTQLCLLLTPEEDNTLHTLECLLESSLTMDGKPAQLHEEETGTELGNLLLNIEMSNLATDTWDLSKET